MGRKILIASNDVLMREITGKFFESHRFVCRCVACDECLVTHIGKFRPDVLITETRLRSRFYSPHDVDSAMTLIQASRIILEKLPVVLIGSDDSPTMRAHSERLGFMGLYAYPLDLCGMLEAIRHEFRRLARLKNYSYSLSAAMNGRRPRGRPRKYPLPNLTGEIPGYAGVNIA